MSIFDWQSLKGLKVAGGRYEVRDVLEERPEGLTLLGVDLADAGVHVVIRVMPEADLERHRVSVFRDRLVEMKVRQLMVYDVAEIEEHAEFGISLILIRSMGVRSLEDYVADSLNARSAGTVNDVSTALANGLVALHRQALVHGGLKPGNIFFDHGEWRLADYALNVFGSQQFVPITRRVDALFVAPEVLYGGDLTPAADVFAFGRVCQWLLEHSASSDWQEQPEYEVLRYVIAQAQLSDPRKRPTMAMLYDVLYEHGVATSRRVIHLLQSPPVLDEVSREIAALHRQPGEVVHLDDAVEHRRQASSALSRVSFEIKQKPHLAIRYLDSEALVHYACVLAMSTFDRSNRQGHGFIGGLTHDSISGGGAGGGSGPSSGQQKRISRGLDGQWRDLILRRYQDEASNPAQLPDDDPFVTSEMRGALAYSPADSFQQLTMELQNASDIRASILEEEPLLTASETAALLAQNDPSVSLDDLLQLEASRTIFSIHDHGARLYPAFQFDEYGRVFSAVSDVNVLFSGSTGWGILVWWRRYHPELGSTPKSALSEANWDLIVSAAKHSLEFD